MAISFECLQCGKKLKAPDEAAGKSSKCPGCGAKVTCPGAAPAVKPAVKAPAKPPAAAAPPGPRRLESTRISTTEVPTP